MNRAELLWILRVMLTFCLLGLAAVVLVIVYGCAQPLEPSGGCWTLTGTGAVGSMPGGYLCQAQPDGCWDCAAAP